MTTLEPWLTPRDLDTLQALDYCPLTAAQLLKISETFAYPFTSERKVRARLSILEASGRVCRWHSAIAGRGAVYYTLDKLGYALLHGPEAEPPSKRAFAEIPTARQFHAHRLADFIVHTAVAAHRIGLQITGVCRENTVRLTAGGESVFPDWSWQLVYEGLPPLNFFLEVDNFSERIRSEKDAVSWDRKIRVYEAVQDRSPTRFRVLVVPTRGSRRVVHIRDRAAKGAHNPQRGLFTFIDLPTYLDQERPLTDACFTDHQGHEVSLVPPWFPLAVQRKSSSSRLLEAPPGWYPPAPAAATLGV
jgi:hypothetical protein